MVRYGMGPNHWNWIKVTDHVLKYYVTNDVLFIPKNVSFNNFGGDPYKWKKKRLEIYYSKSEERWNNNTRQYETKLYNYIEHVDEYRNYDVKIDATSCLKLIYDIDSNNGILDFQKNTLLNISKVNDKLIKEYYKKSDINYVLKKKRNTLIKNNETLLNSINKPLSNINGVTIRQPINEKIKIEKIHKEGFCDKEIKKLKEQNIMMNSNNKLNTLYIDNHYYVNSLNNKLNISNDNIKKDNEYYQNLYDNWNNKILGSLRDNNNNNIILPKVIIQKEMDKKKIIIPTVEPFSEPVVEPFIEGVQTYGSMSGLNSLISAYKTQTNNYFNAHSSAVNIIQNQLQPEIDNLNLTQLSGLQYGYTSVKNENKLIKDQIQKNKDTYSTDNAIFMYQNNNLIFLKSVNFVIFVFYYCVFIFFIYFLIFKNMTIEKSSKVLMIIFFLLFPFIIKYIENYIVFILSFFLSMIFGNVFTLNE